MIEMMHDDEQGVAPPSSFSHIALMYARLRRLQCPTTALVLAMVSSCRLSHAHNSTTPTLPGGSAKQTRHIMQVLDNDGDGEITLDEFIRANRKVGTLMFPAFR